MQIWKNHLDPIDRYIQILILLYSRVSKYRVVSISSTQRANICSLVQIRSHRAMAAQQPTPYFI